MKHGVGWLVVVAGCASSVDDPVDDTETDVGPVDCSTSTAPALEFGQELALGPMVDGSAVDIGVPPQGGAPYAPFELRLRADLDDLARLDANGTIVASGTGAPLGDIEEPKVFLCANVGPHAGWRYGGELHVRFWDKTREQLDGVEVEVALDVTLPDASVVRSTHTGTLRWSLGEEER